MFQFYSDAQFKAPHSRQLNLLSQPSEPGNLVYAYQFEQTGLDVYGKNLNITGEFVLYSYYLKISNILHKICCLFLHSI